MTIFSIGSQLPVFLGLNGSGLNGGKIYIGLPGQDPQTFPKTVYWDDAGTDPVDQTNGIPTIGGYITRAGNPATIFVDGPYSIRALDRFGAQVFYLPVVQDLSVALADFIAAVASPSGSSLVGFQQAGAGATPRTAEAKLREVVSIADYAGSFVEKLRSAAARLDTLGGGTLLIPNGAYTAASSELATGVTIPEHVTVEGSGSTIQIIGPDVTATLFFALNVSGVTIRNMTVIGNSQADAYTNGCFFNYLLSGAATSHALDIVVEDITLENFKAPYWINLSSESTSFRLRGITIQRINATSRAGNAINPTDITWNSSAICVRGDEDCYIENVSINNIWVEATHIKSGIILYYAILNTDIDTVTILNAGAGAEFADDAGCYAIQLYDTFLQAEGLTLSNLRISARSCGIYTASLRSVTIKDFVIFGQTDTLDGTLPKGAIALNGPTDFTVKDGRIHNCWHGLQVTGHSAPEGRVDVNISNVMAYDTVVLPLKLSPGTAEAMTGITISDSRFGGTVKGAEATVSTATSQIMNDLTCTNCYFQGSTYAFDAYALGAAHGSNNWKFDGCTFAITTAGAALRIQSMSGLLLVLDSDASGPDATEAFQLVNCTNLRANNIQGTAGISGTSFNFTGAAGTLEGSVRSVGATFPVLGLGSAKPTHSGAKGDFVRSVNYAAAPAGNGQTQIIGWRCQATTTWRPVVETVNAA